MKLSAIPGLNPETSNLLASCGFENVEDVIFSEPVDIYRRLPPGTATTLKEIRTIIDSVTQSVATPVSTATNERYLGRVSVASPMSRLGIFQDFVWSRRVLEISGNHASGKSTLALNAVLDVLVSNPQSVAIWIDTTGDFSVDRASQILQAFGAEDALERLHVSYAFDVQTAFQILTTVPASLNVSENKPLKCVVIDTITPLLGPLISATSAQGHAIMASFMRSLTNLSRQLHSTFFVLNNSVSVSTSKQPGDVVSNPLSAFASTTRKPALGPSFSFMSDTTIWLSAAEGGGKSEYMFEVFKSRYTAARTWHTFSISDQGVVTFP